MEDVTLSLVQSGFAIALVIGVVEVIKRAVGLATRYVPLVSLALGIVAGGFLAGWSTAGVLAGIVVGLASCGLWDVGKQSVLGR